MKPTQIYNTGFFPYFFWRCRNVLHLSPRNFTEIFCNYVTKPIFLIIYLYNSLFFKKIRYGNIGYKTWLQTVTNGYKKKSVTKPFRLQTYLHIVTNFLNMPLCFVTYCNIVNYSNFLIWLQSYNVFPLKIDRHIKI
jgi:hypothetical protein